MNDSEKLDYVYQWIVKQDNGLKMSENVYSCATNPDKFKLPFEVYPNNLPVMTYVDAVKYVENLGNGWRIPTLEELRLMYQHKDSIGGFITSSSGSGFPVWYWSSTEYRDESSFVHDVRFSDGSEGWDHKDYFRFSCRPVRLVATSSAPAL